MYTCVFCFLSFLLAWTKEYSPVLCFGHLHCQENAWVVVERFMKLMKFFCKAYLF